MPILRILLIVASLTPSFAVAAEPSAATSAVARVVSLRGRALKKLASGSVQMLKEGDGIQLQETVQTAKGSTLKLFFSDQSIVDLTENSVFKVSEFKMGQTQNPKVPNFADRNVEITLLKGEARTSVNQKLSPKGKFRIRTPTSVMGVRGTEILVSSGLGPKQAQTELKVLHGKVDILMSPSQPPVSVNQGEKFSAALELPRGLASLRDLASSKIAPVIKVDAISVQEMGALKTHLAEVKLDGLAFQQAITVDSPQAGGGKNGGHILSQTFLEAKPLTGFNAREVAVEGTFQKDFGLKPYDPGVNGRNVKASLVFTK